MDGSKLSLKILLNCWSNRSNRISLQLVYCCKLFFFVISGCALVVQPLFYLKLLVHKSLTKKMLKMNLQNNQIRYYFC
jgi:hypothetical protein